MVILALGAAVEIRAGDEPARVVVSATVPSASARELAEDVISEDVGRQWLRLALVDEKTGRAGEPIFGTYVLDGDRLTFTPRRGLVAGRLYRAELTSRAGAAATAEYRVPRPVPAAPPTVEVIYPTASKLPANQLKFYIHFSLPMREGREVFERIKLVDDRGRVVPDPWRPTELWTADSRRLTLWIHPGRVKEGVNLREDLGPVLEPDNRYTLVIGGDLQDQSGQALGKEVKKPFEAVSPDREQPTVDRWSLESPQADTREPLVVRFGEPLDRHLINRCLSIRDAIGKEVTGAGTVETGEQGWIFTPTVPWRNVTYTVHVEETLEDLAGNTPARPFEVDLTAAKPAKPKLELEFHTKADRESAAK